MFDGCVLERTIVAHAGTHTFNSENYRPDLACLHHLRAVWGVRCRAVHDTTSLARFVYRELQVPDLAVQALEMVDFPHQRNDVDL